MKNESTNYETISYKEYVQDKKEFSLQEFQRDFYTYTYNKRIALAKHLNVYILIALLALCFITCFIIYDRVLYQIDMNKSLEIKNNAMDIVNPALHDVFAASRLNEREENFDDLEAEQIPDDFIHPDILALREELNNDSIIGYINIPGTSIYYPIIQGEDNEFYLTRDIYDNANISGSIFLDYDNNADFSDIHSVIYGHNMKDGSMFHDLRYYRDADFLKNNQTIELMTLKGPTLWHIYSFFETGTDFNYIETRFIDQYQALILFNRMKEMSTHETMITPKSSDSVLTLSTCTNRYDDTRYVISAIKID